MYDSLAVSLIVQLSSVMVFVQMISATESSGLLSPRGQAGEELVMVMAAVSHKMGECISAEVAKLESEEAMAAERIREIEVDNSASSVNNSSNQLTNSCVHAAAGALCGASDFP